MPSFLVLRAEYPHQALSNAVFSVKKGDVLKSPQNYKPSDDLFYIFESREAAIRHIKKNADVLPPTLAGEKKGKESTNPSYPLFRRVASPSGEPVYQLFARDIHRFLSRHEEEIIADVHSINVHPNTSQRLYDYERKHFSRQAVMTVLEAIIKGKEEEEVVMTKDEKKAEVKSTEAKTKGITTTESIRGLYNP